MLQTFSSKCLCIFLILLIPVSTCAQSFKVTLLGTGTPIPMVERFGPSILVEAGSEKLLFDCGRGAAIRLWQLHIPMRDVTAVFFTHLHSDHIVGFPDLWLTGWLPPPFGHRTEPMHVYGPRGTKQMILHLEKAYRADIRIRIADEKLPLAGAAILTKEITEGVVYEKNGVKVTAFNVDHGEFIKPAFGYRIDYNGRSVVLSGDTRFSENLIKFSNGADVLFHEVAAAKPENLRTSEAARRIIGHHTTPEDAGRVFNRVKPKLAVYTHIALLSTDPAISAPTVEDLVSLTRKTYSGAFEVGEDLMSIEVGDKITVHRFTPQSH
ncbi:MAG TPA: MBL fold metallo-hydrolase [Blastocatellia bacterium]|nr:MBL fold metallo-hydrolase [Blastocatellia bacterium]